MIGLPNDWRAYAAVGAVLLLAYLLARREVEAAGAAVAAAINPLSRDNVFYGGANEIGAIATGTAPADFSLGAWLWERTHPSAIAAGL